jgi:c-di-GMP-binding flagellar brake protein YcgR
MTSNETYTGTDKRQHPRVEAQIPVRCRIQSDTAETSGLDSLTGDVSAGGLRLRMKEFTSAACDLILELDIPTLTRPLIATAKVAWIKNSNTVGNYDVGARFMEITKKDQELISQYANSLQ